MDTKSEEYRIARAMQEIFRDAVQYSMDGKVERLKELISNFISKYKECKARDVVTGFQSEGKTLLHVACSSGKHEVVEVLLDLCKEGGVMKSIVNLADEKGFTPLINATISESLQSMKLLIELGANVNHQNKEGTTALHFAAGDGSIERMALLCNHLADVNCLSGLSGTPLHWAAGKGQTKAIAYLLTQGGVDINKANNEGLVPILMAAASGSDESVQKLVEAGADIGMIVSGHLTTLHICAEQGMIQSVIAMMQTEQGKKCNEVLTEDGSNLPIHLAAMAGHRPILLILLPYCKAEILPTHCSTEDEKISWLLEEGQRRLRLWEKNHNKSTEVGTTNSTAAASSSSSSSSSSSGGAMSSAQKAFQLLASITAPSTSTDQESAEQAAERYKEQGNAAFKAGQFQAAVTAYTQAISYQKENASYWSNRSACYMSLHQYEAALIDAEVCRRLKPDWPKGCYRLAVARFALKQYEDAAVAAFEGCKLDPSNSELKKMVDTAVKKGQEEYRAQQQQQNAVKKS